MSDFPVELEKFLTDSECQEIIALLSPRCISGDERPTHRVALGFPNSEIASEVAIDNPALAYSGDPLTDSRIRLLTSALVSSRKAIEIGFNLDMSLVNASYTEFYEGPGIPMHSDSTKLDGSTYRDDGIPEELEYSAVLYLNSGGGVDFSGGEIEFPKQELKYTPSAGSLFFFKGDVEHIHEVHPITSGVRIALIMFFSRYGNVSSMGFFEG